jgi:mercuric ion transport protein
MDELKSTCDARRSSGSSAGSGTGLTLLGALASLALGALGVGAGLSSTVAVMMPLRWPLTALSVLGLTAGWWSYARGRKICMADRSCSVPLPSRITSVALVVGTAMTLTALLWDFVEAPIMKVLS